MKKKLFLAAPAVPGHYFADRKAARACEGEAAAAEQAIQGFTADGDSDMLRLELSALAWDAAMINAVIENSAARPMSIYL